MNNLKLMRGLVLLAIALFFGSQALTHQIGTLARAGAGLFPLLVSGLVAMIGLVTLVQAKLEAPVPLDFKFKNIALIMISLIGFTLIAHHLGAIAAIIFLVFVSTLASTERSLARNLKICAVLIVIAVCFRLLLGVNLPLY
jgi:uncharacterized membrane protein